MAEEVAADAGPSAPPACKGCFKPIEGKVLRCGVCKETYCCQQCQKEDWKYHKRICKKPEPKAPVDNTPKPSKEEMQAEMDKMTKDQDPKMAAQMQAMMGGMMGIEPTPPKVEAPPPPPCQNCAQPCLKPLRCGTCKAVTYCCAKCQKEDWKFHKRICKAPPAPKPPGDAPSADAAQAPAAAAPQPMRPQGEEKVVESADVGDWYKHREWKPQEEKKDFAPAKLEAQAQAQEGGAGAAGPSAWNNAGSWEEKNMLPWWEPKILAITGSGESLQIDKVTKPEGEAQIVHSRGQPKFLYDLKFDVNFTGLQRCKLCAKSPPGSRCSKCVRVAGTLQVTDFASTFPGEVTFRTQRKEPDGPSHVAKADRAQCSALAEEELQPLIRTALLEIVDEYNTLAEAAPKWASQLPPKAAA